jgi:hypothetical protein
MAAIGSGGFCCSAAKAVAALIILLRRIATQSKKFHDSLAKAGQNILSFSDN